MIQCERGHFFDENRYAGCPYCNQIASQQRSVIPPIAPAMEIPKPSCGKTVAIEGMDTAPQISKTVAIDGFEDNYPHVNKTVSITEQLSPSGLPEFAPAAAVAPIAASAPAAQPAPAAPTAVEVPAAPAVQAAPVETAVSSPAPFAAAPAPQETADASAAQVNNAPDLSSDPESFMRPYQVTGLGVKENPTPIPVNEPVYDRPYAVSGLGVKENPTPTPSDVGATFPVEQQGAAPMAAEAAAFASFGFPGGPVPGMMPGMVPGMPPAPASPFASPAPAAPEVQAEPAVAETPVAPVEAETPVEPAVPEVPAEPAVFEAPVETPVTEKPVEPAAVETPVQPEVAETPAESVVSEVPVVPVVPQAPADPHATVAMTESDMDYLPRLHARAFFVCIDGPMTGASFVFQENKAIIGRQKNYEISLFRDPSVSRNPHAIIRYAKETLTYTVAPGDAEKKVSVNGEFISQEQTLKLYDIVGIGQTRLLFIPVCSEKFAW